MDLIFTKDFFQSGSNRFGVLFHESSGYENFGWLANFLMDDGGFQEGCNQYRYLNQKGY